MARQRKLTEERRSLINQLLATYKPELRRLIYTTNSIENFNHQLRKVTKSKTIFPTDDALFKMLYLAMNDITEKWIGRPRDWTRILEQLIIYFEGRISLLDGE